MDMPVSERQSLEVLQAKEWDGKTPNEQDHQDIKDTLAGDDKAYERLINRYKSDIVKQLWRVSRNLSVCEELVQDVFVEAYFSLNGYQKKAPFIHWLRRIATRVGYRYLKRRSNKDQTQPVAIEEIVSPGEVPDPSVAAAILHNLLNQLNPAEQLIMTLMYYENCSTHEIAARMGWNSAMVKMRAYRARKKLKVIAKREKLLEKLEWMS